MPNVLPLLLLLVAPVIWVTTACWHKNTHAFHVLSRLPIIVCLPITRQARSRSILCSLLLCTHPLASRATYNRHSLKRTAACGSNSIHTCKCKCKCSVAGQRAATSPAETCAARRESGPDLCSANLLHLPQFFALLLSHGTPASFSRHTPGSHQQTSTLLQRTTTAAALGMTPAQPVVGGVYAVPRSQGGWTLLKVLCLDAACMCGPTCPSSRCFPQRRR